MRPARIVGRRALLFASSPLLALATVTAVVSGFVGHHYDGPPAGAGRSRCWTTDDAGGGVRATTLRRLPSPINWPRMSLVDNDGGASSASSESTLSMTEQQQEVVPRSSPLISTTRVDSSPDLVAYAAGYTTVFEEIPFRICQPSMGTIPIDLKGSYYRSGTAMYSAGSIVPPKTSIVQPKTKPVKDGVDPARMVRHPMEGDGAILGITFTRPSTEDDDYYEKSGQETRRDDDDVVCVVRFRYVRTPGFTNERKKGQRMYTGMDSTRALGDDGTDAFQGLANDHPIPLFRHHYQPGLNKLRKNTANTRAIFWGKRLFSLWEGGQAYKMDGRALGTEGRSQFGGAIKKDTDPFGGTMRVDAARNRALFYGISHGPQSSDVTLYEFDADFRLVPNGGRRTLPVPGFLLANDMAVTDRYAVFVAPNVQCNGVQFLVNKDPGKVLKVDKGGTVVLAPRPGSNDDDAVRIIPIPADELSEANIQIVNAYELDGDRVVLDVIRSDGSQKRATEVSSRWPWATTVEEYRNIASRKSLWRYSVDLKGNTVSKRQLLDRHVDFPSINPRVSSLPHRYMYMNVGGMEGSGQASPPQGILRYDVKTGAVQVWMPAPYEFCGEPLFVPRDNCGRTEGDVPEDDGYLLSVLFNGKSRVSELIILDAAHVDAGPITRIPFGVAIPHGYYGCFTSEHANWSPDEIQRRAKLHDKMESRGNYWNEVKSDFSGLGLRLDDMEEYFGDFFS